MIKLNPREWWESINLLGNGFIYRIQAEIKNQWKEYSKNQQYWKVSMQSWTNKAWPIVCPTTRKPSFLFRNEFLLIFQLPLPYITEKQNHDILQCTTRSAHSSLQHTLWHIKREAFLAVLLSILCLLIRLKIQYNKYYKVFNVANWITIMVSIKYYMNWSWFLTDEAPVTIWQTRDSHQ